VDPPFVSNSERPLLRALANSQADCVRFHLAGSLGIYLLDLDKSRRRPSGFVLSNLRAQCNDNWFGAYRFEHRSWSCLRKVEKRSLLAFLIEDSILLSSARQSHQSGGSGTVFHSRRSHRSLLIFSMIMAKAFDKIRD
jgi:hypothetical protein